MYPVLFVFLFLCSLIWILFVSLDLAQMLLDPMPLFNCKSYDSVKGLSRVIMHISSSLWLWSALLWCSVKSGGGGTVKLFPLRVGLLVCVNGIPDLPHCNFTPWIHTVGRMVSSPVVPVVLESSLSLHPPILFTLCVCFPFPPFVSAPSCSHLLQPHHAWVSVVSPLSLQMGSNVTLLISFHVFA